MVPQLGTEKILRHLTTLRFCLLKKKNGSGSKCFRLIGSYLEIKSHTIVSKFFASQENINKNVLFHNVKQKKKNLYPNKVF